MKTFLITVQEKLTYQAEIEAETQEQAEEIAVTADYISEAEDNPWSLINNNCEVLKIEENTNL